MKNNTRKILLALALVLTMLVSLFAVSAFAEDAAMEDDGKVTVYFQNNWLWTEVSCHYWGSQIEADTSWPGAPMTEVGEQDGYQVFSIDVPSDVTSIVITGIKNDGSGALDQTPDIKTGIVEGAGWKMAWNNGNAAVEFVYNPDAAPVELTYSVVGTAGLCGSEWVETDVANEMTLGDDGLYTKTYTAVAAGEHMFKVVKNHSWAHAWPNADYVLTLSVVSDVTITFNPETNEIIVNHVPNGEAPVDPDQGETPVDPDNGETPVDPDQGETTLPDLYLVGWINGADVSNQSYKLVDGKISINLAGDAYVAIMDANGAWYMTDGWLGTEVSSATLYNSSTTQPTADKFDKFFVPGGQVTITVTDNGDGSYNITHGTGVGGSTTPAEPAEDPIVAENGYYKIYVYNTAWWEIVCYYTWNDAGEARAEWPGQDVYEESYLLYPIMIPETYAYVIFNNSNDQQTADFAIISIDKNKTVYNNATGEWMSIEDYDPNLVIDPPALPEPPNYDEYETKRVYLGNTLGWESANFYAWSDNPDIGQMYGWPGMLMDYDDETGLFYADVPVCFENIIFNNGSAQTLDLKLPTDNKVVCDNALVVGAAGGGVAGGDCWFTIDEYELPEPILPPDYDVVVAVKNDAGWENVCIYYWDGESTIEWPGTTMEQGADGYYYAIIPAGTLHVLFHNGGNWEDGTLMQSADLYVPTDDKVLYNNADGQWYEFTIEDNNDPSIPGGDVEGGDQPDDGNDEPAPQLNFFQKLWLAILTFFKKLFAGKNA